MVSGGVLRLTQVSIIEGSEATRALRVGVSDVIVEGVVTS